ncbi:MAG TPA: NADH-quinone oxidoreductase subunit L [Vicinamibacteria bacterium]|nr:NADH-quinone oxidoreductase subunit L [Vicinamibacteria bacterium]
MSELFWLIPLVPGVGALINGLFGKRLPKSFVGLLACGVVALSFLIAVGCFFGTFMAEGPDAVLEQTLFTWVPGLSAAQADGTTKEFVANWAYRLDSLSMVMVLVVSGIGFLIHVYSIGYMSHDPGYARYFCYLNLFTFFMLNLVLGANFLLAFIGWEGVGLCSYLLIGFWFTRDSAANAGKKAFIVNRIGDAGFLLAIMLIFFQFGSVDFYEVMQAVGERYDSPELGLGVLAAIGILLFVGATGKSAQIPLYVWLPDAMEGPTPVSALIHAATMVTAGVYMVARCGVLYSHAPAALDLVAVVGVATALFAASIGLFQNDIKRVLAYSTVSQLGYMFLGAGVGAFAAAIFHLMTHAFFKACLFLGSGSVIHSMEHAEHASGGHRDYTAMQDMRNMGGLFAHMPWTARTFIVAMIAIAGIPPLAGFVSKDEILWRATGGGHVTIVWLVGAVAAGMTAFYMTRQVILTFFGKFRGGEAMESHLHEAPKVMWVPLVVLAVGSIFAGFVGWPHFLGGHNRIEAFLEPAILAGTESVAEVHEASAAAEWTFMLISVAIAAAGIFFAYRMYWNKPEGDEVCSRDWPRLYRLLYNKYYVDEIYDATVVSGTLSGARGFNAFDAEVVDGLVNGTAGATVGTADLSNLADETLVDGAVNAVWRVLASVSAVFRRVQTGVVQNYALMMLCGVGILFGFFYFYFWS